MRSPVIGRRAAISAGAAALLARAAWAAPLTIRSADGRDVQITALPPRGTPRGLVLFSHGALSSPWKYTRLLQPWAEAGFSIFAPLHVDSTENPTHGTYDMAGSWRARILDMRALAAHVDHAPYVAAGHSYGALVALSLGGAAAQMPPGLDPPLRDGQARAVVAFSPPGPSPGLITAAGYGALAVPALIQTGTADVPFNAKDGNWRAHLAAFDAAPGPQTYGLVLPDVNHYFGGLICRPELPGPPQTVQFATAISVSLLFLQAYGAGAPEALNDLRTRADVLRKGQE